MRLRMGRRRKTIDMHGDFVPTETKHSRCFDKLSSNVPLHASSPLSRSDYIKMRKMGRGKELLKRLGIAFACIVGLLALLYFAGSMFFAYRFMPNTFFGPYDVSMQTLPEAQTTLNNAIKNYTVSASGQSFVLKISPAKSNLVSSDGRIAESGLAGQKSWFWPLEIFNDHDLSEHLTISVDNESLDSMVRSAIEKFNATATPPEDAIVVFNLASDSFLVQPEALGTKLEASKVMMAIADAMSIMQTSVTLGDDMLVQPAVLSTNEELQAAVEAANQLTRARIQLMLGNSTVAEVTPELVSSWVRFDGNKIVSLDESSLNEWVDKVIDDCNTVGVERTFTRSEGKVITVSGGTYGWLVDGDSLLSLVKEGVSKGMKGSIEIPCLAKGTAYSGKNERDWGLRFCDIDLSEQYVRFYDESGALVWGSPCITGSPNGVHNTPVGIYVLNGKASPSELKGTNLDGSKYATTVQYWMPFVGNAIGLHDASWQTSGFGGTLFQQGFGSHGCVNLPSEEASELFGIIQSGDVVVCHW